MITYYELGDDGYDDLYAKWLEEGSAAEFEELGLFGGRRWKVLDRDTTPIFLLNVSDGPTELSTDDDPEYTGVPQKTGYYDTCVTDDGLVVSTGPRGKISWRMKDKKREDD